MNWIKCSDKKPDYGQSVLIMYSVFNLGGNESERRQIGIGYRCCVRDWIINKDERYPTVRPHSVHYWTPFPEYDK